MYGLTANAWISGKPKGSLQARHQLRNLAAVPTFDIARGVRTPRGCVSPRNVEEPLTASPASARLQRAATLSPLFIARLDEVIE